MSFIFTQIRRFYDKKSEALCFKRFLKNQKKSANGRNLLLNQGKLEAESDIGVGSGESICHKRVIHGIISKDLKVESVAQHIVGCNACSKDCCATTGWLTSSTSFLATVLFSRIDRSSLRFRSLL